MVSNQKANMNTLEKLNTALENGGYSTEQALTFFDELEEVDLEFMIGRWQGAEFPTNHPMDGLLEASGWYGKEFVDAEFVHPLLFSDGNNNIFKVEPSPIAMNLGLRLSGLKNNHETYFDPDELDVKNREKSGQDSYDGVSSKG